MDKYAAFEEAYRNGYEKGRQEAGQWISVKDKLPHGFVSVLGFMTDAGCFPAVRECYRVGDDRFFFPALQEEHPVSHWMPMPELPKEWEAT